MINSLQRINKLAQKERKEGLTTDEELEKQNLRQEYLQEFRGQVLNTLSGLKIIDPQGNDVTPEKVKDLKGSSLLKEKGLN